MQRALVTGGSGFIGSNLVDYLLSRGIEVVIFDNFSTGRREFIQEALENPKAELVEGDILDQPLLESALTGCDTVFHLAANADVKDGLKHPTLDLEQNTVGISTVLEAMRAKDVESIVFSSTGSVYGEPEVFPTPEDCPFPVQTSLYGASKAAGEGLIAAYCHGYGFTGTVFRFVSILGERYTHGHVYDFYKRLKDDPTQLRVLGNGKQEKSYLYVGDCVRGIVEGLEASPTGECTVFNIGTDETVVVDNSVSLICEKLGVSPQINHTGGVRGWPGDSPLIHLDCTKLRETGWQPELTIKEAIAKTIDWFDANPFVFQTGVEV